jgi:hypothetical protein
MIDQELADQLLAIPRPGIELLGPDGLPQVTTAVLERALDEEITVAGALVGVCPLKAFPP